jgi:hypothetical protein
MLLLMETMCWCCGGDLDDEMTATVGGEVACTACARWSETRRLDDFLASRWLARRRVIMGRGRLARERQLAAVAR